MGGVEPNEYFVIFLEEEGSYSTVHHTDVIFEDSVKIEDEVRFYWNKRSHDGIIKYMSDDYDDCVQKSMELSQVFKQNSKRSESFHEDRPRKSALRCKSSLNNQCLSKRKQIIDHTEPKPKTKKSKKQSKPNILAEKGYAEIDKELLDMIKSKQKIHAQSKSSVSKADLIFGDLENFQTPAIVNRKGFTDSYGDNDDDESSKMGPNIKVVKGADCIKEVTSQPDNSCYSPSSDSSSDDEGVASGVEEKRVRKLSAKLANKFDLKTLELLAANLAKTSRSYGVPSRSHQGDDDKAEMPHKGWKTAAYPSCSSSQSDSPRAESPHTHSPRAPSPCARSPRANPPCVSSPCASSSLARPSLSVSPPSASSPDASCSSRAIPLQTGNAAPDVYTLDDTYENSPTASSIKKDSPNNERSPSCLVKSLLKNSFKGDMFAVKDPKEGVDIGDEDSGTILCEKEMFKNAELSKSTTQAARRLLEGVFSLDAIMKCSISGMPPRGKGVAAYVDKQNIKPYLCPKGVKAIVDQSLKWQMSKHWKPKRDGVHIRQSMSIRLSELVRLSLKAAN